MKKLILTLLIAFSFASTINLEMSTIHMKMVNGDAGAEALIKASTRLTDYIPFVFKEEIIQKLYYGVYLGFGFSQQYTAPRANQFAYNHFGDRVDWSLGLVFGDFEIFYTHSARKEYPGAKPDVLFDNRDVDSIKFRYRIELNF